MKQDVNIPNPWPGLLVYASSAIHEVSDVKSLSQIKSTLLSDRCENRYPYPDQCIVDRLPVHFWIPSKGGRIMLMLTVGRAAARAPHLHRHVSQSAICLWSFGMMTKRQCLLLRVKSASAAAPSQSHSQKLLVRAQYVLDDPAPAHVPTLKSCIKHST